MNALAANATGFMKSTRSIVVVLLTLGLVIGLFVGKIDSLLFKDLALIAFGAYFAKRSNDDSQN